MGSEMCIRDRVDEARSERYAVVSVERNAEGFANAAEGAATVHGLSLIHI